MKNNKIIRYGGIAALILIALYAFTFFSNDARGYVQADTSVALTQLKDKNVDEVEIDDREQRLRIKLKDEITVDEREGVKEIVAKYPARASEQVFNSVKDSGAQKYQMANSSSISEFLLLALADTWQLQLLHFWLLLGIYLAALLGNGLISTAVACDHRLHTPMYFFLLNLAILDLGCISTTLPKAMANALWHTRAISYAGCAAQVFFFFFLLSRILHSHLHFL